MPGCFEKDNTCSNGPKTICCKAQKFTPFHIKYFFVIVINCLHETDLKIYNFYFSCKQQSDQ